MGSDEKVGKGRGRRVQARKVRKDGWTAVRRQTFLDQLATCSNVTRAVEAAGLSLPSAYELRARDPEFAAAWDAALEMGYATLESMLVDRAAGPRRGYSPGDLQAVDPAEMDGELALSLLRLKGSIRRTGAGLSGPKPRRAGLDELTQAILAKLDVLSRRRAGR